MLCTQECTADLDERGVSDFRNYEQPHVELATLGWVHWWNNRRLLAPIGNIPPVEYEHHWTTTPSKLSITTPTKASSHNHEVSTRPGAHHSSARRDLEMRVAVVAGQLGGQARLGLVPPGRDRVDI